MTTPAAAPPPPAPGPLPAAAAPVFRLAPGVALSALDASAATPSYLARLPDGRQFQLTEKLHHLLRCLAEPRTLPALGEALHRATGVRLEPEQLAQLVARTLEPNGLVLRDGPPAAGAGPGSPSAPAPARPPSALALHWARDVVSARALTPVTTALAAAFRAPVAAVLLAATVAAHGLAYARLGLPPQLDPAAVSVPLLLLLFLATGVAHELGHLAAARRWGCPHGALGVGVYFFTPVLYADVTPAWRLPRGQRVVVDLGGMYFEAACSALLAAAYLASGAPTFLWAIVLTDVALLANLNPIVKLDGYWLLSDLTGVPNLHRRAGERALRGAARLLQRLGLDVAPPPPSPFAVHRGAARVAVPVYAALSIALAVGLVVLGLPVLADAVRTYPPLWAADARAVADAARAGSAGSVARAVGRLLVPALLVANAGVLALRLGRALGGALARLWRARHARPALRWALPAAALGIVALAAAPGIAFRRAVGGLDEGRVAPDFTAYDLRGVPVRLSELRGRPVYLKFWSPDCQPCLDEIPAVRAAYRSAGQDVAFLTVAVDATPEALRSFVRRHAIDYPVLVDERRAIMRRYETRATPYAYVIGPDGRVRSAVVGAQTVDGARRDVRACDGDAACRVARP